LTGLGRLVSLRLRLKDLSRTCNDSKEEEDLGRLRCGGRCGPRADSLCTPPHPAGSTAPAECCHSVSHERGTPVFLAGLHLQRFRGGLVFKAHRLVYHSTQIEKKRRRMVPLSHIHTVTKYPSRPQSMTSALTDTKRRELSVKHFG